MLQSKQLLAGIYNELQCHRLWIRLTLSWRISADHLSPGVHAGAQGLLQRLPGRGHQRFWKRCPTPNSCYSSLIKKCARLSPSSHCLRNAGKEDKGKEEGAKEDESKETKAESDESKEQEKESNNDADKTKGAKSEGASSKAQESGKLANHLITLLTR